MTITVFGATGRTQFFLITEAIKEGHKVIGYARNPSKMKFHHPDLIMKKGTLDDTAAIEDAISGSDVVIETVGAVSSGTQNIVNAMTKLKVNRLIAVATPNVSDENDLPDIKFAIVMAMTRSILKVIGLFKPGVFHAVREIRKVAVILKNSELDWTLVRVAVLNNHPKTGVVKSGYLGHKLIGLAISRADFAGFLLQQVHDKTYIKKAPAISN